MDIVEILVFAAIWGMFIFHVVKEYRKSKKDKRKNLRHLLKELDFWVEGLRLGGILLFFSGFISDVHILKHLGVGILCSGWFLSGVVTWGVSKKKSLIIMILAVGFGFVYYLLWF
ncbi:hypothetical protein [Fredinandcohnia sp. 179-A 10B2 NHS]|uniref:hypothetical protein n=1 Tax=Fredinandcohnia sp. 179-A 10B2 NHS TaxID=3235176 RepID=UPI0039A29377